MQTFADLGTSFFDGDFTLNPHRYLEELYHRDDILGFSSEGMNFVFRFEHAREVLFSPHCAREPVANPEFEKREAIYAQRYPNRAKNFHLAYTYGTPDLQLKKLLRNYIVEIAESASFDAAEPIFQHLTQGERLDNYIEDISTIPLRIMLETSGMAYTEQDLKDLYRAGFDFVKALDNFVDETPLANADRAVAYVWDYTEQALQEAPKDAPILRFMTEGRALGITDEVLIVNISAFLLISLSNTAGISSSYLLRNLILNPSVRQSLKSSPELMERDSVIMEFLRRDNHVKALSRQVHNDFSIGDFTLAKGESLNIFFPGVNLDPTHWETPLALNIHREFTGENNIIFGGSAYMCIGKHLGLAFLKHMARGLVEYLPDTAYIDDSEIEVDGDWVAERIITRMPIHLA